MSYAYWGWVWVAYTVLSLILVALSRWAGADEGAWIGDAGVIVGTVAGMYRLLRLKDAA